MGMSKECKCVLEDSQGTIRAGWDAVIGWPPRRFQLITGVLCGCFFLRGKKKKSVSPVRRCEVSGVLGPFEISLLSNCPVSCRPVSS